MPRLFPSQDRGVKEDELQSILNYLLTMHEVNGLLVREGKARTGSGSGGVQLVAKCAL